MNIKIRNAIPEDNINIRPLQKQIADLHFNGRNDLFKEEARYYTEVDFINKLNNPEQFIYIAVNELNEILGYVFAAVIHYRNHPTYRDFDSFYIDDICVDEKHRRLGIGKMLFEKCREQAKSLNCHNIDLGVYKFNKSAISFYESCGMKERMRRMEYLL
jgi:ribosomal protein S18 acetylase RimI-like enzyme